MESHVSNDKFLNSTAHEAVAWLNQTYSTSYDLTGLVDTDPVTDESVFELGLVLCDGEICAREQIRVERESESFRFSLAEAQTREIPPLLDPPEGIRSEWLAKALDKHEFVLLLFYRGLW